MPIPPFLSNPPSPVVGSKPPLQGWSVAMAGLIGVLSAYFAIQAIEATDLSDLDYFQAGLMFLSFLPVTWLALILHEAGHLLGGLWGGMKPEMLVVGPLKVAFPNSWPRFALNREFSIWMGLATCVPPKGNPSMFRLVMMIAGGPTISLLSGLVGYVVWVRLGGVWGLIAAFYSVASTVLGLAALLPFHWDGFLSDGSQLWQMIRGLKDPAARWMLAGVARDNLSGVRPREWSVAPIKTVLAKISDPVIQVAACSVVAVSADDSGDRSASEAAFDMVAQGLHEGRLGSCPVAFRDEPFLLVAIFIAEHFGNADAAKKWMPSMREGMGEFFLVPYARAVIAKARGDLGDAEKWAGEAMALLGKSSAMGSVLMYREKLEKLSNGC